ncbi:non-heme iron oxygenase ferredoxin subunit [Pseudooceanicola sp.]|uniref:non-heme iron oxygenase ferredoxin subunit n=1 Tax=Pseudooceanicola sp. TaxID=1914328 RepID=UPI000C0A6FFA|nr:ferredoxin [Pseudooceanicola sp.]
MNGDTTNKIALFPADDLPEGEIRAETLPNGDVIAVYNVDGTFYATQDQCSHGEASLAEEGDLCGKFVECSWHFGTFDVTTGEPGLTPCEIPLKTYRASVEDGKVCVEY